jgi:serine/threonine protein kinase
MAALKIPGYTLKRKLGQGGMAAVFLAVQESFGREVALKIMMPQLAKEPDFAERFMREARTMAQLTHPHIIVVHDVGNIDDLYYYAMAYHTGGDLTHRLRSGGITTHEALRVTREMADALAYAHEQGIVHRDIKPDNVLFRVHDEAAILTDFGIAKSLNSTQNQLTQAGAAVGTPKYMSPEQARGQKVDGRSDLYSLGVMLYEMLTGHPPFQAAEAVTLAIMHCQQPVPPLREELGRYQKLIDGLLAKEPGDRFADGHALIAEIDALLRPPTQRTAAGAPRIVVDPDSADAATVIGTALQDTLLQPRPLVRPGPGAPKGYVPFFRTEEETSGGMLSKRYAMKAAFSCEDYDEFRKQLGTLQDELKEWLDKRGKKAKYLHLSVQAHPWIHGRVREIAARARDENSPLGTLIGQAEVVLHLCDEMNLAGQTIPLSDKDGKPLPAAATAT